MNKHAGVLRAAKEQRKKGELLEAKAALAAALDDTRAEPETPQDIKIDLLAVQIDVLNGLRWSEGGKNYDAAYARALEVELTTELEENRDLGVVQRSYLWSLLGSSCIAGGRHDAAAAYYASALKYAEIAWGERSHGAVEARWNLVECMMESGNTHNAVELAEANYRIVREHSRPYPLEPLQVTISLARVLLELEAYERARPVLQEACELLRQEGNLSVSAEYERHLAEVEAKLATKPDDPTQPDASREPDDPHEE